jgi:alanine dehydrogenase
MHIGVPKEVKEHEYRVSLTPDGAEKLINNGHRVLIEHSAGDGSGFSDDDYKKSGSEVTNRKFLFENSELIVKVKEPLPEEYDLFSEDQALFTFLHLAPNQDLIDMLLKKNITSFAYETLEIDHALPLLQPMSEIAGKMAPVVAAYYMQKIHGGAGILVTGASDVAPARVLILGAGTVGMGALNVAYGMGAEVTVINRGEEKLKIIDDMYRGKVRTITSNDENIASEVKKCDILIGAVLVTGARAPGLVSADLVSKMKKGSVIVDVSVDQGGCIETTKPTTHNNPVYTVDGVVHYTVANMPGAYPRTSTLALTNKTLEYIEMIAGHGIEKSATSDGPLRSALNTYKGEIMHEAVAGALK